MATYEVKNLSGNLLNMAVEVALGFVVKNTKGLRYDLEGFVCGVVRDRAATYSIDDLIDEYRISSEVAGDGWAALVDDTFCDQTYPSALLGSTRREAVLRAFVFHRLGPQVHLPD